MKEVISHRGWNISAAQVSYARQFDFVGIHEDYDPTPVHSYDPPADNRILHGPSVEAVKQEIDEWCAERPNCEPMDRELESNS